jgi:hypothetical protein
MRRHTMNRYEFTAAVAGQISLFGVTYERYTLEQYIRAMWPHIEEDSDVVRWAGEFLETLRPAEQPA